MLEDRTIIIDSNLRTLAVPSTVTHLGVESDKDVLEQPFQMPRHYGSFDMAEFQILIKSLNAKGEPDIVPAINIITEKAAIKFTWLVGRFILEHPGEATFSVCFRKTSGSGPEAVILQEFNTTTVTLPVLNGIDADNQIIQQYPDVLENWKTELMGNFTGKIDTSLTKEGDAADAYVTGARMRQLRKDLQTEITVEQSRVDQLMSLATGSVSPDDAELVDIRVGSDGKTYDSAGKAVRGQINKLTDITANSIWTDTLQQSINDSLVVGGMWRYKQDLQVESYAAPTSRGHSNIFEVLKDTEITIGDIYFASIIWLTSDDICVEETGWTEGPVIVEAGSRFAINFRRADEADMSIDEIYDIISVRILDPEVVALEGRMDTAELDIRLLDSQLSSKHLTTRLNEIVVFNTVWNSVTVGDPITDHLRNSSARATLPICKFAKPIDISAASGFVISVLFLDDDLRFVRETGWVKETVRIPAETNFALNISNSSHSVLPEEDAHRSLVGELVSTVETGNNAIIQATDIEYGRYKGSSYVFVRIPRMTNAGVPVRPKIALTSLDGSLTGSKRSALSFAATNKTAVTMNAGLFDVVNMVPVGQTIIDGVSVTNTPMESDNGALISDIECYPLCIDANGTLSAPYARDIDTATMLANGITQAITGWGKIVDNFVSCPDTVENEIVHDDTYIRQSIGQFQNGDYFICTIDQSRGHVENEAGITYEDMATLLIDKGVKFAYSLDGGGSAETVVGVRQINPIYEGTSGRAVPTVIYFEEVQG